VPFDPEASLRRRKVSVRTLFVIFDHSKVPKDGDCDDDDQCGW
jgi:hypothetical protein